MIRRIVHRTAWLVVAGLIAAGLTVGGSAQTQQGRVLNVGLFTEPDFIDPHVATSSGFVPVDNVYEGLVYTDRDQNKLVPQLAESWTAADDSTSSGWMKS